MRRCQVSPEGEDFRDYRLVLANSNPRPFSTSYQSPNNLGGNPSSQNRHVYTNPTPPTYPRRGLDFNQNPNGDTTLEDPFSRFGLGNPSPQSSQWYWENYGYENGGFGYNTKNDGFSSSLHANSQPEPSSNRMRSYLASAGLGLPRSSSATAMIDCPFPVLDDDLDEVYLDDYPDEDYLDNSFPNLGVSNTSGIYPRRNSQSNINGIGTNPTGCRPRSRSVNGLESAGARSLPSSLYNNRQAGQPRNNCNHHHYRHNNHNNHRIYSSLDQVKGRVASVARDQEGCRFLQRLLEKTGPEHVEMVFLEVKDHVCELMVDQFGNYLVQKLFESCDEQQMSQIVLSFANKDIGVLLQICAHPNGTRAMQKMIGYITTQEQRSLLVSALEHITVSLTKDQNGHHVVRRCLIDFPADDTKYMMKEIADHCLEISMDKSGCCVVQEAARARGKFQERLISEIVTHALVLAEDPFGNYVVQFTLVLKFPRATACIIDRLRGNFAALSMNKYGSNVVEKCLKDCGQQIAALVIQELMDSFDFLNVLQDQYGNFVAQSALEAARGFIRDQLIGRIQSNQAHLHSHLFGKKVLARTRGIRHRVQVRM